MATSLFPFVGLGSRKRNLIHTTNVLLALSIGLMQACGTSPLCPCELHMRLPCSHMVVRCAVSLQVYYDPAELYIFLLPPLSYFLSMLHFENLLYTDISPTSGLAYFTDVGHCLVWVYLSYDRETCTTDQPFGRVL